MRFAASIAVAFAASILSFAAPASGQEWARKMFETTDHDFGTVAKDATTTFDFEFVNSYVEDVHVSGVRASCGCTTPVIVNDVVKTWEKGVIRAVFNTDRFTGQRGATVTVTFDKPFYAEVQLRVKGNIRSDLVFEPGEVAFGTVDQGQPMQKRVSVTSFGRPSWKIRDVRSASDYLSVQILDEQRQNGRVRYDLAVNLKENAPAGYLQDQLTIVSDDSSLTNVPLMVTGRVSPSLTVSPQSLYLGDLKLGETATKNLIVKSATPVRIAEIVCDGECVAFQFDPAKEATLHVIPVTLSADRGAGKFAQRATIRVESGASATCDISATIFEADPAAAAVAQD